MLWAWTVGVCGHGGGAKCWRRPWRPLRDFLSGGAERDPLDGRIILVISNNDRQEPRFENDVYRADTQLSFGIDVDGLKPGADAIIDAKTFGYPLTSIERRFRPGEYWVQAVLNRYETFHRGDGQHR